MPQAIVKQQPIKDRFVEELRTGMSPGKAARTAGISRAGAYRWRNEDPAFDRAWVEAVAEGIDKLEDEAFRRAVDGYNARTVRDKDGNIISEMREYSDSLLALLLKVRRPETFNRPVEAVSSRVDVRVSLSEARERLERLGLPIPEIEGDYERVEDRSKKNPEASSIELAARDLSSAAHRLTKLRTAVYAFPHPPSDNDQLVWLARIRDWYADLKKIADGK